MASKGFLVITDYNINDGDNTVDVETDTIIFRNSEEAIERAKALAINNFLSIFEGYTRENLLVTQHSYPLERIKEITKFNVVRTLKFIVRPSDNIEENENEDEFLTFDDYLYKIVSFELR